MIDQISSRANTTTIAFLDCCGDQPNETMGQRNDPIPTSLPRTHAQSIVWYSCNVLEVALQKPNEKNSDGTIALLEHFAKYNQ